MRRAFWILITPLAGFLVFWLVMTRWAVPHIEKWALFQVKNYIAESTLPFSFDAESLHIRFLKPSVSLEKIKIAARGDLKDALKKAEVKNVQVFVDFFHLLSGKLIFSAVLINEPNIEINIDPLQKKDKPPQELPMDLIFEQAKNLPLNRIFLNDVQLDLKSDIYKLHGKINNGDLLIINQRSSLITKAAFNDLKINLQKNGNYDGSLETQLYLTRQFLRIIQLGVKLNESELFATGELIPIKQVLIRPQGFISASAKVNLNDIYKKVSEARPTLKIPAFSGQISLDMESRFDGFEHLVGKADIKTRALVIDKFEIGNSRIQGDYKNQIIKFSEVKVQHPAGEALITKAQLDLNRNFQFETKISLLGLDLQELFQSLDLSSIPVGMDLHGEIPCEGQIQPKFKIVCSDTALQINNLWVKSSNTAHGTKILDLDSAAVKGQVQITGDGINYAAGLKIGSSAGESDGVIDFRQGFKINFKTKKLDFSNIKNLANLKLAGSAGIEGSTSGNKSFAVFNMNLSARNSMLEGFAIGNFFTNLKYNNGHLLFSNITGNLNKTQYLGDLDLNLNDNTLKGDFSVPTAYLEDVFFSLKNLFEIPVSIRGVGSAKAHILGPLNFWNMNYKLESFFKKVEIGAENFDQLSFNVTAKNGNINTDNVSLKKSQGTLAVHGNITSNQFMHLDADGKGWKLEDSTIISGINSNISGNLNFSAEIKDSIKKPQVLVKGAITDTVFEDSEIPNSNFILRLNKNFLATQLSLFGNKVQGEVQIPFTGSHEPLRVKMKTNNWNYSALLGLIGGSNLAAEYWSNLTSSVDLHSESGEFFKSSGKLVIDKFALKRGTLSFENSSPIDIAITDGLINIKNFKLEGPKSRIHITGSNFTTDNLNVAMNVQADMRLLQIFLPFLEDLGGPLSLSTTVSGSIQKPQILGNLGTENAFIKIKNFPHPIERLSTEVVFSQSKVLINAVKGQMAGGTLTGDGAISINGLKDLPTTIRLHLEDVTLNVPDKVRTNGNADLMFTGHWFPFTLAGVYTVNSALVEKEFTEEGNEVAGVKQSLYLPKLIREGQFEPILLDLEIILDRNILIKNSQINGSVSGHLLVKGVPSNPILLGKIITLKQSKLIFKDKVFDIQNGTIEFDDPNETNPMLYISAQSRINEYDISLLAQGKSKNLDIRLSSVPPLREQDIISLIALGITGSAMEQNLQSRQQAEQLGVEIGGAVLAKPISKKLESTIGFNLQVTSQYDSTRNISVPKITLSRQLTDKVKVSGSRPVGNVQSYDLKFEYLLNSNVTAIGSFESRGIEDTSTLQTTKPVTQSIFGLDLEFKREFK